MAEFDPTVRLRTPAPVSSSHGAGGSGKTGGPPGRVVLAGRNGGLLKQAQGILKGVLVQEFAVASVTHD